jgi:hypothetical protein
VTRRRVVEVLVGVALAGVSFLGVLYQVNESMAAEDAAVPRLLCPLH